MFTHDCCRCGSIILLGMIVDEAIPVDPHAFISSFKAELKFYEEKAAI